MTRAEFGNIVKAIKAIYVNNPITTQEIFDLWYSMLSDMSYQQVSYNLQQHIKNNKFAPTISELRGASTAERKDFNNFHRRQYNMDELEQLLLEGNRRACIVDKKTVDEEMNW